VTQVDIDTSAPGKLVVIGEYAVLEGHPAVVAAVDVRARVTITPADTLVLEGNASGPGPRERLPLLDSVLREVERLGALPTGHFFVDTSAFSRAGQKVGLGSSAAACVAFTRSLLPDAELDRVYTVARAAHHAFQGGGSGIDVAASTYGGLIRFTTTDARPRPVELPDALAIVVVFTGTSTSTQGYVDRWHALSDRELHASSIAACARTFIEACSESDVPGVLGAVGDACAAMRRMGEAAGIDVVSAQHARIAQLARAYGGEAKPSGAGGGDVAVAVVPVDARGRFSAAVEAAGFSVVPVGIAAEGVQP
jgi:mevalonate kinase